MVFAVFAIGHRADCNHTPKVPWHAKSAKGQRRTESAKTSKQQLHILYHYNFEGSHDVFCCQLFAGTKRVQNRHTHERYKIIEIKIEKKEQK